MLKGYKYRIFPTDDQKDQLQRYFGVNRLIYNLGPETKTVAYASNKTSISKYDLIKQLPELRKEFDYIKYGKDKPAKTDITVSPSELDVPNKELSRQVNRDDEIFNILGIDPSEFSLDFIRIVRRAYELYKISPNDAIQALETRINVLKNARGR